MRPMNSDRLAVIASSISALFLTFLYGAACMQYQLFPHSIVRRVQSAFEEVFGEQNDDSKWFFPAPAGLDRNPVNEGTPTAGVNFVTYLAENRHPTLKLMTNAGDTLREWDADWFRVWPDPAHIPTQDRPKHQPGTHIHGAVLQRDGSVVFSYTALGLVKLDVCGEVVWRLPYRTHHSIIEDEQGTLWIPGQINHTTALPDYPNLQPPFVEETLLKVSTDGKVLEEIRLFELLRANQLQGLLLLSTANGSNTSVSGDFAHANDFEPFPAKMTPGIFGPGDAAVSIRNANTVLVFNVAERRVKYVETGLTVRQHDPDFFDGNTLSLFDNNNVAPQAYGINSRIVLLHAPDNRLRVVYQGSAQQRFYSDVMGKHQWLDDGHLLVTEARSGRAFELDAEGRIVWQYYNRLTDGRVGLMEEVSRLPPEYGEWITQAAKRCP
jgi:Arylsulfotransferase (ASST)